MKTDPGSLENLKDIAEPPTVSWWPLAIGWWVLITISFLAIAWMVYRAYSRWKANAYRRSALREIQDAVTSSEISEILKRTSLVAFPRSEVASLSGQPWCDWLAEKSNISISDAVRKTLREEQFRPANDQPSGELVDFATNWIQVHDNPTSTDAG